MVGRATVLIDQRMAATLASRTGCGTEIVSPGSPTVVIGGPLGSVAPRYGRGIVLGGTDDEVAELAELLHRIAESGSDGEEFVDRLDSADRPTEIRIARPFTPYYDNVRLTGGGLTYDFEDHNEIYIDPSHVMHYRASGDPPLVRSGHESPSGLLLHEMGHAQCRNEGAPSHAAPDPGRANRAAENDVIDRTNGIRRDLGLAPEHSR